MIGGKPSFLRNQKRELSDFAILYRTNAQSRALEEVFLKSGLPYRLFGGVSFYERKEIKDVLSYLKLLANPKDSVAKKRIEKLGKGRAEKFYQLADGVSEGVTGTGGPPSSARSAARTSDEGRAGQDPLTSTLELMDQILEVTGYLTLLDDGTDQGKMRVENVKELRSVAEEFPDLHQFLENVALIQDNQMPDLPAARLPAGQGRQVQKSTEAISLMTIHSSKGLEFPVVFLVGMEEGLFPHSRSMLNPDEMEEERRLCYVGITRAKQKLYLTYTRSRLYFGTRSNNLVSRFLTAIPDKLIDTRQGFRDQFEGNDYSEDVSIDEDEWLNI